MSLLPLSLDHVDAVLFDLDGVLTDSAALHAKSWKKLFDGFLRDRDGEGFRPFDADADYRAFVDGKPRLDGIRSFLDSRSIELPEGTSDDSTSARTVWGLGRRKNGFFLDALAEEGIITFPAAIAFLDAVRAAGFKTALVSSSRNARAIVEKAGLRDRFDAWIDGDDVQGRGLAGKPAPDMFLAAAKALGVEPGRAVVVEDAIAGVEAGLRGRFGLVIGVDRTHHPEALAAAGAHLVVARLSDIPLAWRQMQAIDDLPSAMAAIDDIQSRLEGKRLAVCLDYDGTLTPIVDRPELALLSDRMRQTLARLADVATVAVISGRDLKDIRRLVALDGLYYSGSHGFEIAGPDQTGQAAEHGAEFLPLLDSAENALRERLAGIDGVLVERKRLSVAVHYRLVAEADHEKVKKITDEVVAAHSGLRRTLGKMVYDLQPDIDWHKGKAVATLLSTLGLDGDDVLPLYIGDDVTDEDAFRELRDRGLGIVVRGSRRSTSATLALDDTDEVQAFLEALMRRVPSHRNRTGNAS
ncbi:MAG: trehalose-phosphatase [Alphaproteobacteria bacterium]